MPEEFSARLHSLLGVEADDLIKALDLPPVCSVRLNRRKPGAFFSDATEVKWCRSGRYLKQRPEFIFDPLLHAGAYYVQDASSMIYEEVTERLIPNFKGYNNLHILDMCAAPGGKTTAMINALPDGATVTANEYSPKRLHALKENIDRWGYPEVLITNKDASFFETQEEEFDIIAVDAPCSGEGMMRKEEVARTQWSPKLVEDCSMLQKDILKKVVKALKPGGFLIYSTCTFNRCENEENAEFIHRDLKLEPEDLHFPLEWGIQKGIDTTLPVYRFMPHKTQGEGLFLAVFRKSGEWKPTLNTKWKSENKGATESFPTVEVDKEKALAYLRRESIVLRPEAPKGLVTITYKGLPLGPAKNIGTRANNLYPKNRRILKR